MRQTTDDLATALLSIDKTDLTSRFKACVFHHSLLHGLLWRRQLYEILLTTMEALERKLTTRLRRWHGLPKILSSNALRLPLSSFAEEFPVSRTREVYQYLKFGGEGIATRTGWICSTIEELEKIGITTHWKTGVGYFPYRRDDKA